MITSKKGVVHSTSPWDLAADKALSELFDLREQRTEKCDWRRFHCDLPEESRLDAAAWLVAAEIMALRCNRARDSYRLWESAAKGEALPTGADPTTLAPFIEPSLGLPPDGISLDHTQGYIAEVVWRTLAREQVNADRELVYLARPDPDVHSPGADGFAIYKEGDRYVYRIWEIKKREGDGAVSGTISRAYAQLKEHAERYLAKLTALSEVGDDDPLRVPFAELVPLWKLGDPSAGAGIAVAANAAALPQTAFSTMHDHFPNLAHGSLEGCLVGLGDFPEFCTYVRRLVWNGLSIPTP